MTDYLLKLMQGDCIEQMRKMPDNFVDSIVTDPPYELGFMGKKWDSTGIAYNVDVWEECLRVLKPGGHLLAFGGTRTYHRMACAIEDAGFEIRDQMQWLYGSGFPKSMDIGKAVDKTQGNERQLIGKSNRHNSAEFGGEKYGKFKGGVPELTKGTSEWEGWGTCLKPAHEPICLARKPISEKTIAENVLKWGTGGLNIDGSRIAYERGGNAASNPLYRKEGGYKMMSGSDNNGTSYRIKSTPTPMNVRNEGRFPANIILDREAGKLLDSQSGINRGAAAPVKKGYAGESNGIYGDFETKGDDGATFYGDTGGASRFFYCPKASKSERGEGNSHPTVKPVKLIEYLAKLVTPPNGIVLDPFMGSGTTGVACVNTNRNFIGIELDADYYKAATERLNKAKAQVSITELVKPKADQIKII